MARPPCFPPCQILRTAEQPLSVSAGHQTVAGPQVRISMSGEVGEVVLWLSGSLGRVFSEV